MLKECKKKGRKIAMIFDIRQTNKYQNCYLQTNGEDFDQGEIRVFPFRLCKLSRLFCYDQCRFLL